MLGGQLLSPHTRVLRRGKSVHHEATGKYRQRGDEGRGPCTGEWRPVFETTRAAAPVPPICAAPATVSSSGRCRACPRLHQRGRPPHDQARAPLHHLLVEGGPRQHVLVLRVVDVCTPRRRDARTGLGLLHMHSRRGRTRPDMGTHAPLRREPPNGGALTDVHGKLGRRRHRTHCRHRPHESVVHQSVVR